MKRNHLAYRLISILIACVMVVCSFATVGAAATTGQASNRFNIVILLDASGSMRQTDPYGYRFQAISQFTGLLAEKGNYLGGIVFSTGVCAEMAPDEVAGQDDKDAVTQMLRDGSNMGGWTNTGAALSRAVEMLETSGDPDLPSVILLLSDGNTEMGDEDATRAALELKAEALQEVREFGHSGSKDHNKKDREPVRIFSVCLNANAAADVSEMRQLADATGGVFQEVTTAEDLQKVFGMFYELIYGTSTIELVDEVFPSSGILETTFDVPGIGVEEVNVIIYGNTTKMTLFKPDGSESNNSAVDFDTFSMLKITNVTPGTWTLVTEGVPGDSIKINMVFNPDLSVELSLSGDRVEPTEAVTVTAKLKGNSTLADVSQQYIGYDAELQVFVLDHGQRKEFATIPMKVANDHFEVVQTFDEGTYFFKVLVTGNFRIETGNYTIEKESEEAGPLTSVAAVPGVNNSTPVAVNTPPVPVNALVEESVNVWPFVGGSYVLDMNTLATDAEDSALHYEIVSTSFMEGTDYTVSSDGILTMDNFSLSLGAFTIRATDAGGLSCDIEVVVRSINIGLLAAIGLGIAGLIGAAVFGFLVYTAAQKLWRGSLTVRNSVSRMGNTYGDFRGSMALKRFAVGNCGIDGKFVALGRNRLEFVSKKPVYPVRNGILGSPAKRILISEGTIILYVNENKQGGIEIEAKPAAGMKSSGGFGGFGGGPTKNSGKSSRKSSKPSPSSNPFSH